METLQMRLEARIQELEAQVNEYRTRAERDGLTGCLRREAFMALIESRKRFGTLPKLMTLVIVDLDHFKSVNDTYGHLVGDQVLSETGQSLLKHSPEGSFVCRMGGEEFVLAVPMGLEESLPKLEHLREKISQQSVQVSIGKHLAVTASLGVALWDTDRPMIEATARADAALYRAKKEGRNRVAA